MWCWALIAKADVENAFRILPTHPSEYHLLGFIWNNLYYYHKRLVMGGSPSCSTFEQLSRAIQWILRNIFNVKYITHILDDFIFVSPSATTECQAYLSMFINLAAALNIPLNMAKTVQPSTTVIVHGYEMDTIKMQIRLPDDKITKARTELENLLHNKKATLQKMQSVIGFLNFTCAVIPPGRPFLRRMINLTMGISRPHHYIRITKEVRSDIRMWL